MDGWIGLCEFNDGMCDLFVVGKLAINILFVQCVRTCEGICMSVVCDRQSTEQNRQTTIQRSQGGGTEK